MERNLRSSSRIPLIGFEESQILGSKLPTVKQVLQVFFYYDKPHVEQLCSGKNQKF